MFVDAEAADWKRLPLLHTPFTQFTVTNHNAMDRFFRMARLVFGSIQEFHPIDRLFFRATP